MKYTINTFIKNLIGDEEDYNFLIEDGVENLYWDGSYIHICKNNESYDSIQFAKIKPSVFTMDLSSEVCWYFTVEFSDGGLKKNKIYNISDFKHLYK